ncbi:DUF2490 domain-containing protein [Maribacter algarum]|nr:DUF2490 domain-containing protein [Maribacter algarum]
MYFIRGACLCFAFLGFQHMMAQENFTGLFQPKIAVNYEVSDNYKHNFSIAQRNYFYQNEVFGITTRQIDLVHFSNLKVKDDQSIALGIQYRIRENFEVDKLNELRFTQQYNITHKPRNVRFGHRFRAQQRITSALTVHRFRYRFAIDFPLSGEQLDVGEPYLIVNTEALLSVARTKLPQYDQRISANIGWLVAPKTKLQAGLQYRIEDYTHQTRFEFFIHTNLIVAL